MATTRSAILAILTLVVPLLLDLIELKFQHNSISVFEAHPITTKVAIAALQLFACHSGLRSPWKNILLISLLFQPLSSVLAWCFLFPLSGFIGINLVLE
ncbi:hypothetical protein CK203_058781 [Vitis vinifera]|uniref:Uncharacterized protein n=1 Tax=Vitis vinifera TaxID=29760 RepID=A0A438FTK4_VITVI|nr:hypothetical protein CK203_058781 [Vitis vinifera]